MSQVTGSPITLAALADGNSELERFFAEFGHNFPAERHGEVADIIARLTGQLSDQTEGVESIITPRTGEKLLEHIQAQYPAKDDSQVDWADLGNHLRQTISALLSLRVRLTADKKI